MRKLRNRLSIFPRAIAAICVMSVLSTTSLFTQESASKKIQTAVQRGAESGAVTPDLPDNPAPKVSRQSTAGEWHIVEPQQKSKHWIARHPLLTGMLIGAGAGATYGIIYRLHHSCPNKYDGMPYQGTPWGPYPCPK